MKKRNNVDYKLLYEKELLEKHTKHYVNIPFPNLYALFGLFGSVCLAVANFFLILKIGEIFKVWTLLGSTTPENGFHSFYQLIILYPIIGGYIFVGLSIISFVALCKGGYDKLKKYDQSGLIVGLIGGLSGGMIVGLIGGLIFGLIFGLIVGLIFGLIVGLINGLIVGLIFGLIGGLIVGLSEEFE